MNRYAAVVAAALFSALTPTFAETPAQGEQNPDPAPCPGLYRLEDGTPAPALKRYQSMIGWGLYRSLTVNFLPHPLLRENHMGWAMVAGNGQGASQYVKVLFLGYNKVPAENELAQSEELLQPPDVWLGQMFVRDENEQWRTERWESDLPHDDRLDGPWYFENVEGFGKVTVMTAPSRAELPKQHDDVFNPAFGKEVRTETINLRVESFGSSCSLGPALNDILAVRYADVPVHTQADSASGVSFTVSKGEYLGVLKTEGDWLQVARPLWRLGGKQLRVARFFMDSEVKHWGGMKLDIGWINRKDLYAGLWVPQRAQTPQFRFEAAVNATGDEDSMPDERGQVLAVKVIDRHTGASQVIDELGYPQWNESDAVVQVLDVNFDDYPDFYLFEHDGGAGPNDGNAYYLYDPANSHFEYNEGLSDLTQVEIDTKAKLITSAYRNGAGEHGGGTYTFENGKLVQLTSWVDRASFGGFFGHYEQGERVKGQWRNHYFATSWFDAEIQLKIYDRPTFDARSRILSLDQVMLRDDEDTDNPLWFELMRGDTSETMGWVPKTALLPKTVKPLKTESAAMQVSALMAGDDNIAAIALREPKAQDFFQIIVLPQYLPWRTGAARLAREQGMLILSLHWPDDEYPPTRWRYDAKMKQFVYIAPPKQAVEQ